MRNSANSTAADEETLVGLAKAGSNEAFGKLVKLKQSWLRNFLRRLTNDRTLADDLSQQVFLSGWKNLRTLKSNKAFHSWLKRIAVNTWLNHARRNEPLEISDSSTGPDIDLMASGHIEHFVEKMDIDHALAALGVDMRLCIVLSYYDGLSHGTIAELTNFPLGTVKSHIRRGTQLLRNTLAIYGDKT